MTLSIIVVCCYAQCRLCLLSHMLRVTYKHLMQNVIMQSVVMLNVIMLSIVLLNAIMLSVIMLNIIMLSVAMLNIITVSG